MEELGAEEKPVPEGSVGGGVGSAWVDVRQDVVWRWRAEDGEVWHRERVRKICQWHLLYEI